MLLSIITIISVFTTIVINQTVSEIITEMVTESVTKADSKTDNQMVYKTTNDVENDQLQILHSTPEAAFFIEGCTGLYENVRFKTH